VVQLASSSARPSAVLAGLPVAATAAAPNRRYLLQIRPPDVAGVLARLHADNQVSYAAVPQVVHATVGPNDPCYLAGCVADGPTAANQDYLNTIGAPAAWAVTHGDGITVAVLDSGVDSTHPDLNGADGGGNKIAANVNVCARDDPACAGPGDGLGHGTHVAGILGADTNNGIGVASLGWGVTISMYQVLDADGFGNTADVATAIYGAVAAHVRVISMSLSNFSCPVDPNACGPDPDEQAAVDYALAHNVVVVAAAGNDGLDSPTYPASYPGVLSVAATDDNGAVQPFSQWGSAANIAAPGTAIVSTWPAALCSSGPPPCYHVLTGTSMATPQVAAAAALMIAHDPSLSGPQVTELLRSTVRPTTGGHPIAGGVLDVPAALAAESQPPHLFDGYDAAGSDGSVYSFGSVVALGDLTGHPLNRPVVGIALRSDGLGYWMDAADGGVFSFGDARFFGSTGNVVLRRPVVGMASTPDGLGYWLVASDGGVFSFGDARFFGSTGKVALVKPVVGMASTPDGRGYWMVAADGGVFAFGDGRFWGSAGGGAIPAPVAGLTS
jgi:subtilisin family serine protease